ncbi:hypothetical protein DICVIV_03482 [Dictyocaulus viviparus]|uniref:Secreted protein n=1 Tax=Dictyocaulus viviparus TaxID=29172 RepID=A0A0D8Y2W0_DICVI|nr:hypothetical protein DICVIV_03482 [Dictyocaulus viviparus]
MPPAWLVTVLCLFVGALLWFLESKNIYHFDTIFSARRHAEGSVVDVYRDDESVSTILSDQTRFTSSHRLASDSPPAQRCPSIASEIFFPSDVYQKNTANCISAELYFPMNVYQKALRF